MKLRIKGNSLRLRVTRPELDRLMRDGRVEETTCFGLEAHSRLGYSLEHNPGVASASVRYDPPELAVILPTEQARQWANGDDTGIYARIAVAPDSSLELVVEKDFACLHGSAEENRDAFPNPYMVSK